MSAKMRPIKNLPEVNRQIVELKKKIQLSEGQRKALFEECEAERKTSSDQILKLKKNIRELTVAVKNAREGTKPRQLPFVQPFTPLAAKNVHQAYDVVDLQVIGLQKKMDLLQRRTKLKRVFLKKLADEYQELLSEKSLRMVYEKIDRPFETRSSELKNRINEVRIQKREAETVRRRYREIRRSLLDDSSRYNQAVVKVNEALEQQKKDTVRLKKELAEANVLKNSVQALLQKEERASMSSARVRERQAAEWRALLSERKLELERLERRVFQSGRLPPPRPPTADTAQDDDTTADDDLVPKTGPEAEIYATFAKLSVTTGGTTPQEVMGRFKYQRDTRKQLDFLRKKTELEKRRLEKLHESLIHELDKYKFVEANERETSAEEEQNLKNSIDEQEKLCQTLTEESSRTEDTLNTICSTLRYVLQELKNNNFIVDLPRSNDAEYEAKLVRLVEANMKKLAERAVVIHEEEDIQASEEEEEEDHKTEDIFAPEAYNALTAKSPQIQQSAQQPTGKQAAEDDEEVPSRGFLKRQAQLVVDAKYRRKNIRLQMAKTHK